MPFLSTRHCPMGHPPYHGSRCPLCAKASEAKRPNARQRGYTREWDVEAKAFLAVNRICRRCGASAQAVDHVIAHKGNMRLFWDRNNWQPLCLPCNSRKAVATEGGFGRDREALPVCSTCSTVALERVLQNNNNENNVVSFVAPVAPQNDVAAIEADEIIPAALAELPIKIEADR